MTRHLRLACLSCLLATCNPRPEGGTAAPKASSDERPAAAKPAAAARLAEPIRLTQLPVSAYHATLALDDEAVYVLTAKAAFRVVPGQAAQAIELDLGTGSTLTSSAFVYWSKGWIWSAPKSGGDVRQLARFPHQPQYFVSSGDAFAWIALNNDGLYTIQTLDGRKPRQLVSSRQELSALNLIGDQLYFIERPTDSTWRFGKVRVSDGSTAYGPTRSGRRPSMLTGSDALYYFDVDKTEILKLSAGLEQEETLLRKFVCSPIHVSNQIYCGCVEGLFEVARESHQPRVLAVQQPGPITNVASNSKWVAFTVDSGRDKVTVNLLPVDGK